jgi:hypothetical protein
MTNKVNKVTNKVINNVTNKVTNKVPNQVTNKVTNKVKIHYHGINFNMNGDGDVNPVLSVHGLAYGGILTIIFITT